MDFAFVLTVMDSDRDSEKRKDGLTCVCVRVCARVWKPQVDPSVVPLVLSTWLFETESLLALELTKARLVSQQGRGSPSL